MTDPVQHERELREQWQTAHLSFHTVEKEALILARREIERRLEGMNELRQQINNERGQFLLRESFDEQHGALRDTMDARLKLLEQSKSNMEGRIWMMGAAISALAVGLNLILHYFGK